MRICHFNDHRVGVIEGDEVIDLTASIPVGERQAAIWVAALAPAQRDRLRGSSPRLKLADVRLSSPVASPGKVVAAPVNYKAHVQEMLANGQAHGHLLTDIRQAGLFLKAPSSVIGPSGTIEQRFLDRRTDYELELCAVIGTEAKNVRAADALAHVAGYCLGLDITVRGPEDRSFRKSIDTYCVLGPWLTTASELGDPGQVDLELRVNGELRQKANTADMVLSVAELIEFATSFYSLHPGDVIMTGTPQGVGPIRPGDVLVARGAGLGEMTTHVVAAP